MNPARKKKQEQTEIEEYDPELLEMKRKAEAAGLSIQIPRLGAVWREPRSVRVKGSTSLSETLIQLRRGEP